MVALKRNWWRVFVAVFLLAQGAVLAVGLWWFLDLRAAEAVLAGQRAVLEAGARAAPESVAELEKARQEAQAKLQEVSASLPDVLHAEDVVEQVYLSALAAGVQVSQVSVSAGSSEGTALRKVTVVSVSATVPDTVALLRWVSEIERGPLPAYVKLPSLQVFQEPTSVSLQVEFWSKKGLEVP